MPCKKFWVVWNRRTGRTSKRHETRLSAISEARRLAIKEGHGIYVLESVGVAYAAQPVTVFSPTSQGVGAHAGPSLGRGPDDTDTDQPF